MDSQNKLEIFKGDIECLVLLDAHECHHSVTFELLPLIMILLKISKPMLKIFLPISIQLEELTFKYLEVLLEDLRFLVGFQV